MVDFVAVDFKPLKGGVPDVDDIKAANYALKVLSDRAGFDAVLPSQPFRQERDGVWFYTIVWEKVER